MLWWGLGLVVAAALVYWLNWSTRKPDAPKPSTAITVGIMVVATVAGVGALVHLIRVGDSGARAAWGHVSEM